ncbi:YceK/YidQ family lipoprotein [Microbulbifer harenosus]|uniref:YceK/YidQ family lipoprotein n=1 Tax=Microbulbifer harenosus TaxID=2576840 RepID=A0ABY2UIV3_9GAMM|nr:MULTISPECIES: YceK/YidQ family lipoprotein [Microbulbifer]QIL88892.1 YceK/YidQ family lipoprotein [Microbulbifer sp. SH-1]TLM77626.1 YceK/YidQ family lipoprotein [Microbulbifer harenosus]
MKYASFLSCALGSLLLSGCGTVTTLTSTDQEIATNLNKQKSSCISMPRVYSGVAYNMCKLNSNGSSIYFTPLVGVYLIDSVFSAATDTVALPYTIYTQSQQGNLDI